MTSTLKESARKKGIKRVKAQTEAARKRRRHITKLVGESGFITTKEAYETVRLSSKIRGGASVLKRDKKLHPPIAKRGN